MNLAVRDGLADDIRDLLPGKATMLRSGESSRRGLAVEVKLDFDRVVIKLITPPSGSSRFLARWEWCVRRTPVVTSRQTWGL